MVRRLPVLQNEQAERFLSLPAAVMVTVVLALLVWAPLLWISSNWGAPAIAGGYVASCAMAATVGAQKVPRHQRGWVALYAAGVTGLSLWGLAGLSGAFPAPIVGLASLIAILVLSLVGFPAGLLVLFWRGRSLSRNKP